MLLALAGCEANSLGSIGGGTEAPRVSGLSLSSSKVICSLRLDPRLRRCLDAIADQRQLSFNSLVAMTLAEYWRFDPRRAGRVSDGHDNVPIPSALERQTPPPPASIEKAAHRSRNAPCPCGSGLKYKRCCGMSNER